MSDTSFAELVCALSSRLAGASGEQLAQEVVAALEAIRTRFGADQCGIMQMVGEGGIVLLHRVAVPGVPPAPTFIDYGKHFPAVYRAHTGVPHPYVLDRLEDIAPEDAAQLESSRALELGAYIGLPIAIGGEVRYSLALACNRRSKRWPRDQVPLMQVLGETIAYALERERDEARVRRSESDLAQAQRVAGTGSWVRDFVADHFSASEQAYRIIGARPNSSAGWMQCIHADDRERVAAALAAVIDQRKPGYDVEYRVVHPRCDSQDEVRLIADRGEIEFDADGRPLRALGSIRDLTDARRAESELRALRSRIWHADRVARASALGGSLSHELRQPLTAILASAQAGLQHLDHAQPDHAELRSALEAVVRDNRRAVAIIDGLGRLLRGGDVPKERLDAAHDVGEVAELLRGEFDAHAIDLHLDVAPPCVVWGVKAQLQQVALNLLANAIDAVCGQPPGQRRIALRVARVGDAVEIEVDDSGAGIRAQPLDAIFEPFHTTRPDGLGLGLAISRSIVEEHGGRIDAQNLPQGGARLRIRLPLRDDALEDVRVAAAATVHPPEPASAGRIADERPCVCIVDDDAAVRDAVCRLLTAADLSTAAFASGEEFLASPERTQAACVVLDVRMKGLKGPELHARLAELDPLLPVVFLSGHGDLPTGVVAMRQGAVDFLQKPVDGPVLVAAVHRALAAAAQGRAHAQGRDDARARLARLTPREREVLEHVIRGRLNKQIAADLGITETTVKQHRGRVMHRLEVPSVAALVRLCERARTKV